jgi:predicted dehydrogenase
MASRHSQVTFGVIGCGTIAQAVHIPSLVDHPDAHLAIVCDRDSYRRDLAGRGGARQCASPREVFGSEVDAVLIATHDLVHDELVADALDAGKHVFVEKPLALESTRASKLVTMARACNRMVAVGYQRLHDPILARFAELLPEVGGIEMLHMHDFCHNNALVISEALYGPLTSPVFAVGDSDYSAPEAWAEVVKRVHGAVPQQFLDTYRLVHNLACHDLSVLIHVFGAPRDIAFAEFTTTGFGVVVYQFDAGTCVLELGQTQRKWFDQRLRVIGKTGTLEATWATPFVPGIPSELTLTRMGGNSEVERIERLSHMSLFRTEIWDFVDRIVTGQLDNSSLYIAAATTTWLERTISKHVERNRARP